MNTLLNDPALFNPSTRSFMLLTQRIISKIPDVLLALAFLLAGLFIARALRTVAERILDRTGLDGHTGRIGVNEILARLGLGKSPTYVISLLIYWFVLLSFFLLAAQTLNMSAVSEVLGQIMLFIPKVIMAILIVFGGLMLSKFLSEVVQNASSANNISGGHLLARVSSITVIVFTGLLALDQLGAELSLITSSIQILIGGFALAFALAFGLGGKGVAEEILREALNRKK